MVETTRRDLESEPLSQHSIHKLNVIVHGSGISTKDIGNDESMIAQDLLAHAAVPSGTLYAYDKDTNSEIAVDRFDYITAKYGNSLRLVTENERVREIHNMFLIE
jgi:hypothetical protein